MKMYLLTENKSASNMGLTEWSLRGDGRWQGERSQYSR